MTLEGDAGLTYPVENAGPTWMWGVTLDYTLREIERTETYLSEGGYWSVDYSDYDADMWGFTVFVTPPCFPMIDFSYRSGDMEGNFMNFAVDGSDGPYMGRAEFDRDVFLGIGYEYLETDDSGLDMTTDGFFASVGVKGEW